MRKIGLIAIVMLMAGTLLAITDAKLKISRALPASTTAVTSTSFDSGKSTALGDPTPRGADFVLVAPALNATQLPDTKTMTYAVIMSDNADMSSPTTLYPGVLVQTGASSAGAATATFRFRVPSTAKRYIGFTVTPAAAGTGDASGVSATLEVDFK